MRKADNQGLKDMNEQSKNKRLKTLMMMVFIFFAGDARTQGWQREARIKRENKDILKDR